MKKYLSYEIRRNLALIIIASVFTSAFYVVSVLSTDLKAVVLNKNTNVIVIPDTLIYIPIIILMALCTLVPIYMFRFKMSVRETDCLYSMPISRQKIFFVKSIVGLIITLIPYSICYWLGFGVTALKADMFDLVWFVPAYFISLPLSVMLFGIVSFAFTRANHVLDGILLIAAYVCLATMLASYIDQVVWIISYKSNPLDYSYWFSYSPLVVVITKYNALIKQETLTTAYEFVIYIFCFVCGIAAWLGFLLSSKNQKAENAGRVSDSVFAYRIMLPIYLTLAISIGFIYSNPVLLLTVVIILYAAVAMIFRRTVRLKRSDYITAAAALAFGLIQGAFISLIALVI